MRRAFRGAAAAAVLVLCAPAAIARETPAPSPENLALLRAARADFHSAPRPAYIVYTVDRRDTIDGVPDFDNTYTARIWCRTSDGEALTRRVRRSGRATGEPEEITVRFDDRVDPGPPTADLFEPARPRNAAGDIITTPKPATTPPPEIGHVVVRYEADYRVANVVPDGDALHLSLEPLREAERNRVRDVWLDRTTHAVQRMILADHLYTPGSIIPERFDVRLGLRDGLPLVTAIHGQTDHDYYARNPTQMHTVDYRYYDVRFADSLPDWYFDHRQYRAHHAELPET